MPIPSTALAAMLACATSSYNTIDCGGMPINVPKDCSADGAAYVRTRTATIRQELTALEGKVDAANEVSLAGQISQLTGQMDQLTVQYQTTLVSLCQSQQMDPCNAELRSDVATARERFGDLFLAARSGVESAVAAYESGDAEAAEQALAEANAKVDGEEPAAEEAPSEEPAAEDVPAEEPASAATPAPSDAPVKAAPTDAPTDAPTGGPAGK